jgi:formate dehydrogenase accessory protein FdhE
MPKDPGKKLSDKSQPADPTSPDYVPYITGIEKPFLAALEGLDSALEINKHWEGITSTLKSCRDIVSIQSDYTEKIPDSSVIDRKTANDRIENRTPALNRFDFMVFHDDFPPLFWKILRILTPEIPEEIARDSDSKLLEMLINGPDSLIDSLEKSTKLDSSSLLLSLNAAYQVFVVCSAEKTRGEFAKTRWDHGYCPMCGSGPEMGRIVSQGSHFYLVCSLCFTEWKHPRLKCPFCSNEVQDKLGHFSVMEYKGYRVNICKNCNSYLKVSLESELGRHHIPIFDTIYSIELDSLASKEGFKAGEIMFNGNYGPDGQSN